MLRMWSRCASRVVPVRIARTHAMPDEAVGDRWPLKQLAKLLVCDAELLRHLLVTYKVEVVEEPEAEALWG